MTKIFEIVNDRVHKEYPQYDTVSEAYDHYSRDLTFVEAPDNVWVGFGFDSSKVGDERFIRPELSEGWVYDEMNRPWNPEATRSSERKQLHSETTDDTMQAYRKLREGDKTIDWQAWLDALDAYNVAIEETKNQEGYPLDVSYPEYPTKPTPQS